MIEFMHIKFSPQIKQDKQLTVNLPTKIIMMGKRAFAELVRNSLKLKAKKLAMGNGC
jgi:hypothetical protein